MRVTSLNVRVRALLVDVVVSLILLGTGFAIGRAVEAARPRDVYAPTISSQQRDRNASSHRYCVWDAEAIRQNNA